MKKKMMHFGNNIKVEKYNEDRITLIKMNLEHHISLGSPRQYEIQVDGMKAVLRTDDITQFNNYEMYLSAETDELKINLFHGNGHKYDGFTFKCQQQGLARLDGIDSNNATVEERVQQAMQAKAFEDALKKIEDLEADLVEAQEYIDTLEDKLDKAEVKYYDLLNSKPNFQQTALDQLLTGFNHLSRHNPKALEKIPIIGQLLAGNTEAGLAAENDILLAELHQHKQKIQELQGIAHQQSQSTFTPQNETE
jgi:hypothetical protein